MNFETADEAVEFLESCDGYGIVFTDEDEIREFLKNHYGLE